MLSFSFKTLGSPPLSVGWKLLRWVEDWAVSYASKVQRSCMHGLYLALLKIQTVWASLQCCPAYSCSRVNFIHTYLALSQSCSLWSLVLGYFLSPVTCESLSSILSCKSCHSLGPPKSCQVQSLHLPTNLAKRTFDTQISVIWFFVQINEYYRYAFHTFKTQYWPMVRKTIQYKTVLEYNTYLGKDGMILIKNV